MKLHYVYYAITSKGKPKVGCTKNIKFRIILGKYQELIILEAHDNPQIAGDREIELQLLYFGKRDSKKHYTETLKLMEDRARKSAETRKRNKTKIKITTEDIKKGHKTKKLNLEKNSFIFRGKDNGYEPPKPHKPLLERMYVGVNHQDAKLNPDKVRDIRKYIKRDEWTISSLSSHYGVSYMAIKKVVNGITWKHVI
jgi:hypothetical protein